MIIYYYNAESYGCVDPDGFATTFPVWLRLPDRRVRIRCITNLAL
jgi:hypothetical protein